MKTVSYYREAAVEAEISSLDIRPYMDYISRTTCFFNVNSTEKATVSCTVYGYAGTTTKVSITTNFNAYGINLCHCDIFFMSPAPV